MNTNVILGVVIAVVLAVGGYFLYTQTDSSPITQAPQNEGNNSGTPTSTPSTPSQGWTAKFSQVKIALLDTTGNGTGKSRGCDAVNMVTRTVPETTAPLTAALTALFAEPAGTAGGSAYNFIAHTKSTLKFDRVTITNGTANIYLTGSLSGLAGVCDDPRAQIQLEETALQFATVKNVQLYLNNTKTNLTPSQQ